MKEIIKQRFLDHLQVANAVMNSDILAQIERIAVEVKKALANGKKVLFCGNGGSASDSEHIVGELLKKFKKHRDIPADLKAKLLAAGFKRNAPVCLLSH